ncbi:MAG: hypothetical protein WKG01_09670 [Kofleriaceae bacterium]
MLFELLSCPDCPPARLARELVFADLAHLGYAALPFAITGLAIVVVTRLVDREGKS